MYGMKARQKYEMEQMSAQSVKEEEPSKLVKELIHQVGVFCTPSIETQNLVEPMAVEAVIDLASMVILKLKTC